MRQFGLSIRQVAEWVFALISERANEGLVRRRTREEIRKALVSGEGKAIVKPGSVLAYAQSRIGERCSTLEAVVIAKEAEGNGVGSQIVDDRLRRCWRLASDKPVVLACAGTLEGWYAQFGFLKQVREICPEEFRGGRTIEEWLMSDREWMVCTHASYLARKRQAQARQNALVKISGDLILKREALVWLRELTKEYYVTVCTGGGSQISEEFRQRGWPIEFGPMGRKYETFEQRQTGRNVLETNQAQLQDKLDRYEINARVLIPVMDIGGVLCPINGDLYALAAYNGYDKVFVLTTNERVAKKQDWLRDVARVFGAAEGQTLDKIEVIGL